MDKPATMTPGSGAADAHKPEGERVSEDIGIQPAGFVLELSLDWIVLRASENVHKFLGEYHVRMAGEPLASFTLAQPLHDLRNSLARQRGASGIARAYRVRLVDGPRFFDFAFQLVGDRILLEGVPARDEGIGAALSTVSALAHGLRGISGEALIEGAARRMRALTGYDRACVTVGERRVESSRGRLESGLDVRELPSLIVDTQADPVPLFPRRPASAALCAALLRSPSADQLARLRAAGIRSVLKVPLGRDGCVECDSRLPSEPSFELHAAAELLAQVIALKLELDEQRP